jgi:hypothetical protein
MKKHLIKFHGLSQQKLNKEHRDRMYLNITEALHNIPTPVIILKGDKMKIFPLRTETRQISPLL